MLRRADTRSRCFARRHYDSLLLLGKALSLDDLLVDFSDRAGTSDLPDGLKGRPKQLKMGRNRDLCHAGSIHDAPRDRSNSPAGPRDVRVA